MEEHEFDEIRGGSAGAPRVRCRSISMPARSALGIVAILVLLAGPVGIATAQEMSSPSFRVRGGTLSGGGSVDLQSTTPGTNLGSVGTTIGQSSPIGVSTGPTSGIRLEGGFWPVAAAPVPEPSGPLAFLSGAAGAFLFWRLRRRGS